MSCKYTEKKVLDRKFMKALPDADLLLRRKNHEEERLRWSSGPSRSDSRVGSIERGRRLIWMREVRTEIRERRLDG